MKKSGIEPVPGGTVTAPRGFVAGATHAGVKKDASVLDLGILYSEAPCALAVLLTTNKVKSAPTLLNQERAKRRRAVALIANSGCANASTGEQGMADAREMAELAAKAVGTEPEDVLVCSTGTIGKRLPMPSIRQAVGKIALAADGGHDFARAIMTTDRVPKEFAVTATDGDITFTVGGVAKGSGMIHPDLATMFGFVTTDAAVEPAFLDKALRRAVNMSFNMVSVDGDTSPSDTVAVLANGLAGNPPINGKGRLGRLFQQALNQVCVCLAKWIARDGEGATKLIEVTVTGAKTVADARLAARTVVNSSLVKTAVHGADPNWGRIVAAVGRSGAQVIESGIDVDIGDVAVMRGGAPQSYAEADVVRVFKQAEVRIGVCLNLGRGRATAWGCDLSAEYVKINSEYMT
jgi:glutamate N-acetyltransferase/amino-acid N-acetyltransferase